MIKKLIKFILVVSVFISIKAFGGTTILSKTLSSIEMGWGGEGVYVSIKESLVPVEGCVSSRFRMSSNTPLFNENLSILLSAFHTKTKVKFYIDGCLGNDMYLKAVGISN